MQPNPPTPPATQPTPPAPPMAGMMGDDDFGGPAELKGDPNYKFGEKMQEFKTTIVIPPHSISFDENKF